MDMVGALDVSSVLTLHVIRATRACCCGENPLLGTYTSGIRRPLQFRQKAAAGLGRLVGWQEMATFENWKGCGWIGSGCELNQGINNFSVKRNGREGMVPAHTV